MSRVFAFVPVSLCVLLHAATLNGTETQVQLADRAEAQMRAGDNQGALSTLQKASEITTYTATGEDRIGFLYAVSGRQDDASLHFRKAIAKDTANASAHYHLGVLLWLSKEQTQGLAELQTAAKLDPNGFDYRYRLGSAYLDTGSNDQAAEEFQAAASLDGSKADVWQQLGIAEQRRHDLAPAVSAFAKAVELNPDNLPLRDTYAVMLIETRQPERGIAEAEKVLQRNQSDFGAHMNVGYGYLKMGDFAKAEAAYRKAAAIDPQSAAPHYDLAIALKMQDQIDEAKKELQRTLEIDPTLAEARYTLGITNWQAGDFPGTIEQMKAALALRPDYAEAHYMLGIALKQNGDLDAALEELKASIKLDPTTPGPYNSMGQILRIKGDKKGSAEAFATGAKLKTDKDKQLANNLEQGMRGGVMPAPMTQK